MAPWDFQVKLAEQGMNFARSAGGPHSLIGRLIRAAFLDPAVYREVAADQQGNGSATIALAITSAATLLGAYLIGLNFPGLFGLIMLVATVAIQVASMFVAVYLMAAISKSVVERQVDANPLYRAMCYAQSPGVFGIVPVIGTLLGLWRLVTSVAAVREVAQCDTVKAVILLLIGAVIATVLAVVVSPILLGALAFLR